MSVTEGLFSKLGVKNEYLDCSVMGTESLTMVLNNNVRLIRVAIIFGDEEVMCPHKFTEFREGWAGRCAARDNTERRCTWNLKRRVTRNIPIIPETIYETPDTCAKKLAE